MAHLIKYSFKANLREFTTIFWSAIFPFILATLFFISFGGAIFEGEFEPINVGVVVENPESTFLSVLNECEGNYILQKRIDKKSAEEMLENTEIEGFYVVGEETTLNVKKEGVGTSILSGILSEYDKNVALFEEIQKEHPENIQAAIEALNVENITINEVGLSGNKINANNQFFYALIAMAALYGGFLGLQSITQTQANLDPLGARRCISPTHKLKLLISEIIVNVTIQSVILILLIIYLKILGVVLGGTFLMQLLICIVGAIIGVTLGILVGCISKISYSGKVAVLIAVTMIGSFFAGLMYNGMKGIIDRNVPIVNRINPAALISDAFYSMTVYDNTARYSSDLLILCIEAIIILFVCFAIVRRERYDNI